MWVIWSNAITILASIQGVITLLMVDQEIFTHETFRYLVLANAIVTGIISQIKKNNPPGPRPTKNGNGEKSS
jgi:hypothetical protein